MISSILKSLGIISFDPPPYLKSEKIDCVTADSCFVAATLSRAYASGLCVSNCSTAP